MSGDRRRLPMHPPEINLIPMLDMISLLIQVLLLHAQFGALAEVSATAASRSTDAPPVEELMITVDVTARGYTVAWTQDGGRRQEALPCAAACAVPQDWDAVGLERQMRALKRLRPAQISAVVRPSPEVGFDVLTYTMDAVRGGEGAEALFPNIAFADAPGAAPAPAPGGGP